MVEVRELLQPSMLLKGIGKIEGFQEVDVDALPSYTLERIFSEDQDLATHIKILQLMMRNAKREGYTRVDMSVGHHYDGFDGADVDVTFAGWRPETRDERLHRLRTARKRREAAKKASAKRKVQRAKKERADYERLKKKFEGR
jgi:hypothetical protein